MVTIMPTTQCNTSRLFDTNVYHCQKHMHIDELNTSRFVDTNGIVLTVHVHTKTTKGEWRFCMLIVTKNQTVDCWWLFPAKWFYWRREIPLRKSSHLRLHHGVTVRNNGTWP